MFLKDNFFVDSRFTSFSFFSESFLLDLLLNKKDWLFGFFSAAVLFKNKVFIISLNSLVFFVHPRVVQQKESIIHWHVTYCYVVSGKPPMWYCFWWFLIWQIQQQAKLLWCSLYIGTELYIVCHAINLLNVFQRAYKIYSRHFVLGGTNPRQYSLNDWLYHGA